MSALLTRISGFRGSIFFFVLIIDTLVSKLIGQSTVGISTLLLGRISKFIM